MAVAKSGGVTRDSVDAFIRRLTESDMRVWRIYLYGSHATGSAGSDSDIDLAVFLDADDIDGFSEEIEMMRLRRDIDIRIEPHAFARGDFDENDPYIGSIVDKGERIY